MYNSFFYEVKTFFIFISDQNHNLQPSISQIFKLSIVLFSLWTAEDRNFCGHFNSFEEDIGEMEDLIKNSSCKNAIEELQKRVDNSKVEILTIE
ncbi:hypothetical protein ALGA_0412 [Labilibaculum antarcticum]|uniref:Uncharacterized protein n=1 Tax=Labilibaculum antarcticum TaxID=1717717 RepID=A0A1Y1CEL9_9BACT|nr:hypothetical protein ALGA_0412 [Labilibaculum antarcticum]